MSLEKTTASAKRYVHGQAQDRLRRDEHDYYPTPEAGTRALLRVESFSGPIWEPACGCGAMSRVLLEAGYEVFSTDLVDRGFGIPRIDFLMEHQARAPNIVTNPPFRIAPEFIRNALALTTGKVALLLRLAFLEGTRRRPLFESTPLARVWVFSDRLKMQRARLAADGEHGGFIAFAWYVWEHGHHGPPQLGWIEAAA